LLSFINYSYATLTGLPAYLPYRLQSVLNVAARSMAGLRRSEHITDALASFHWLRVPERIKIKLAVIVYRALHGTAPQYLSDQLQLVANLPTRRRGRLRSMAIIRVHHVQIWWTSVQQSPSLFSLLKRAILAAICPQFDDDLHSSRWHLRRDWRIAILIPAEQSKIISVHLVLIWW